MTGVRLLFLVSLAAAGLGTAAMPGPAAAQSVTLTPEQISAFHQQIGQARQTQDVVAASEACVASYSAALQARGSELESMLADNLHLEQTLGPEVTRLGAEAGRFAAIAADEQRNLDDKQRDLQSALDEQKAEDDRLQECRRVLTILDFLCDWGDQAVRDLGWMRNVRAEMDGIEARLASARNGAQAATVNLAASQAALMTAGMRITAGRMAIPPIEAEIVRVKATVSDLHVMRQDYKTYLDDFASLLEQVDAADPESLRARAIIRLSTNVDGLVSRAPAALSAADAILPEDVKQACSTH